jgi:hypothetical protein
VVVRPTLLLPLAPRKRAKPERREVRDGGRLQRDRARNDSSVGGDARYVEPILRAALDGLRPAPA